jgi:hypothetical protein
MINVRFRVEIKNFGTVAAEDFVSSWKAFIDDIEQSMPEGVPAQPSTIFPGKTVFLVASLGRDNYKSVIIDKTKTLDLEITVSYDGLDKHYVYCEKDRFSAKYNAFQGLGAVCTHP